MKTPATPLYVAAMVAASTLLWWMDSADRAESYAAKAACDLAVEHEALARDGQTPSERNGGAEGAPAPDAQAVPELVDESGPDYIGPAVLRIRWPDGARGSLWHEDLLVV
jgi:hypothetical protein